ncbi:MAG TPA: hypothetical protein VNA25_23530 [Phycisphaerae bacterium]|nr:hypothetical protein [Phycisphaerae bacterium]
MSEGCNDIHPACAHAFGEIVAHYARLNERTESMERKLDGISRAVVGNGSPHESLASRVERLEAAAEAAGHCRERFWKVLAVLTAVAAVVVAIVK